MWKDLKVGQFVELTYDKKDTFYVKVIKNVIDKSIEFQFFDQRVIASVRDNVQGEVKRSVLYYNYASEVYFTSKILDIDEFEFKLTYL